MIKTAIVVSASLLVGCSSEPASPGPLPEQVNCDRCGKPTARADARAEINLEGMDVHTCKDCVARPKKAARPRR